MTTLETEKGQIETAVTRLEGGLRGLYQPDGSKIYTDELHAKHVEAALSTYDATVAPVLTVLQRTEAEAERQMQALDSDPAASLTTPELERAAALQAFVREDAETLDLDTVATRMQAALAEGDRVQAMLWRRYGLARLEAERANGDAWSGAEPTTVGAIRSLADKLAAVVSPDRERRRRAHQETLGMARSLKGLVEQKRPKVDASGNVQKPTYRFMGDHDVAW